MNRITAQRRNAKGAKKRQDRQDCKGERKGRKEGTRFPGVHAAAARRCQGSVTSFFREQMRLVGNNGL